jgi:hypothetical protein
MKLFDYAIIGLCVIGYTAHGIDLFLGGCQRLHQVIQTGAD